MSMLMICVGMVPPPLYKFSKGELAAPGNLPRVYRSWTYFKTMKYSRDDMKQAIEIGGLEFKVLVGKRDSVILPKKIKEYTDFVAPESYTELDLRHHQMVDPKYIQSELQFLNSK